VTDKAGRTNEMILTELLLNRPQDELRLLIAAYKQRYGKDLVDAVKSDLSGKLERCTPFHTGLKVAY